MVMKLRYNRFEEPYLYFKEEFEHNLKNLELNIDFDFVYIAAYL